MWGCSKSTEPEVKPDPTPTIAFSPLGQGQSLKISETMDFAASVNPAANISVSWYLDGALVGQDAQFSYVPETVGRDTLKVGAFSGAVRDTYYWVIDVQEDDDSLPDEVPNVEVLAGPYPADVIVSWIRVSGATFPLEDYLVAISYDGSITEANWDQATLIGTSTAVPGQLGYSLTFTEQEHGMRPGERAWFAVRVRDDRQQLSVLNTSPWHDITWPWYLSGTVTDDAGIPLPVVQVVAGDNEGNTDGTGVFFINDPFRSIDSVRVATSSSSWYNFLTPLVSAVQEITMIDITLINRYALGDPGCWSGDYLNYLRGMTRTREVPGQPAESLLFTWADYPVSVFIPPGVLNQAGVDMEQASLAAMDFLNLTMRNDADLLGIEETDYLVRTSSQAEADIVFLFEERAVNNGLVTLELPAGQALGKVIPELMQIWINTHASLDLFQEVQGVALHEFGHTLGLFEHVTNCPSIDYLMEVAGGAGAMNRLEPIHIDERRAFRAIRMLPQGVDMTDFE